MAKVRTPGKFVPFFLASTPIAGELTYSIVPRNSSTPVFTGSAFAQLTEVPTLAVSAAITMPDEGAYYFVVYDDGAAVAQEQLDCFAYVTSDHERGAETSISLSAATAGGTDKFVFAKILEAEDDDPAYEGYLTAPYDADLGMFACRDHVFEDEGSYFVVWYAADTEDGEKEVVSVTYVLVVDEVNKETVRLIAGTLPGDEGNGTPHAETTVVVSDADGVVETVTTDVVGEAIVSLYPGDYTFSLIKDGIVFTTNNFAASIVNSYHTATNDGDRFYGGTEVQAVQLATESVSVSVTPHAPIVDLCKLSATFYGMDGAPKRNVCISVSIVNKPSLVAGSCVADAATNHLTNHAGYVEFNLVRGITVDIAISAFSMRRRVTVPDAATADILSLLDDAPDAFTIQSSSVTTAPRRTL